MKYQLLLVSFIFAFGYIAKANLNNDGYLSLFNGKDLKGWNSNDSSKFKVENAQLIGFQEDGKGANLFTDKEYDNFSLRFSYKVKWPANSGIWFRNSYQFDILKYANPKTYSGAFYYPNCPGTFAWTNEIESLEKKNDWNEGEVLAQGNRIAFWLNGKPLGDMTLDPAEHTIISKGKIGIQVHGGDQFKGMQITLRKIEIRPLPKALLQSNDRVAFVGGGLIERARLNGHLETALQTIAGSTVKNIKFRNLGWSGDTVYNDARSYFGKPIEGRQRLRKVISEWKPNIIFLNYGAEVAISHGQAWTGEQTVSKKSAEGWEQSMSVFIEGYQKLIDSIREEAGDSLREVVIISPPAFENLGDPMPDHFQNNQRLAKVCDALRQFALKNQLRYVDWFLAMGGHKKRGSVDKNPLTHDGLHFSNAGYQELAKHLVAQLGYGLSSVDQSDPLAQKIRDTTVEKNRLFFHRWRPANETYLYLFRKHEQGNNAKEIPQFDPIIEKREKEIESLRSHFLKGTQG